MNQFTSLLLLFIVIFVYGVSAGRVSVQDSAQRLQRRSVTATAAATAPGVCEGTQVKLGRQCLDACPSGYTVFQNNCLYVPSRKSSDKPATFETLEKEYCVPRFAFFMTIEAYAEDQIGQTYENDPWLQNVNCAAGWRVVNEMHYYVPKIGTQSSDTYWATHEDSRTLYVAWRGTNVDPDNPFALVDDIITDLSYKKTPFVLNGTQFGEVHHGFLQKTETFQPIIEEQISMFYKAGWRIVYAGHSLGAAESTLNILRAIVLFGYEPIRVYSHTFGSPRVGDAKFVSIFDSLVRYSRRTVNVIPSDVLHTKTMVQDIVTGVPPARFNFAHVKGEEHSFCNPSTLPWKAGAYSIQCHLPVVYGRGIFYEQYPLNK